MCHFFLIKWLKWCPNNFLEHAGHNQFVSFWQYFPHSSDCFPHSFSSQEFGKTSLWNKYHSLLCDFWKFVGKTHHSCKFLGHSRPNGLSWPKNLHSLWVFSSLIFPRSRSREMINTLLVCIAECCLLLLESLTQNLWWGSPSLLKSSFPYCATSGKWVRKTITMSANFWVMRGP